MSLAEAVARFVATLTPEHKSDGQRELNRFVRWYGGERPIAGLRAQEVAEYAEGLGSSVVDASKRLEPVRDFLSYAKKERLTGANLAPHLRLSPAKKGAKSRPKVVKEAAPVVPLTSGGRAALEAELESLKKERPRIVQAIQLAAADKDFRENAPLEAAKEQQGQIEARIRDLEAALKSATVFKEVSSEAVEVRLGCTVTLCHLDSGDEMDYILVSPREADPVQGKLSVASPMGEAILGRSVGDVAEVTAPVGTLRYRIVKIKR